MVVPWLIFSGSACAAALTAICPRTCCIPAQPFLVPAGLRKDPKKVEKEEKAKQDAEIAKEKEAERENDTSKTDDMPADEPVESEVGLLLAPRMHA